MQALHDVVQAGYVRYIGMSSCQAYQCEYSYSNFLLFVSNCDTAQSTLCRVRVFVAFVCAELTQ